MIIRRHFTLALVVFGLAQNSLIACKQSTAEEERYFCLTPGEILEGFGVTLVAAVGAPIVATAALGAAGFSAGGIAAGSIAATVQAGIGNVVGGSVFAGLQSAAATGGFAVFGKMSVAAGATAGAAYYNVKKSCEVNPKE